MSGWAPPDSDLLDPSAPGPGASWSPPDSDLIAGAPDNSSGTRVANPGTESFGSGAIEGGGAAAGMWAGARLGSMTGSPWGVAAGMVGGAVVGSEGGAVNLGRWCRRAPTGASRSARSA